MGFIKTLTGFGVAAAAVFSVICASAAEPCDLVFRQEPCGKYIYCNNNESVRSCDLADRSNKSARFLMSNEKLASDSYAMFVSFLNRTDIDDKGSLPGRRGFDIDVDVLFRAREDTVITIKRLGFEVPEHHNVFLNGTQYSVEDEWGCFSCWATYTGMPIKQINSGNVYNPTEFEPVTVTIAAGGEAWLSQYIQNYREVPFARSVNIMTDFTIESGVCDVDVAALRSTGIPGDRSNFNPNAAFGSYIRDRQYKGISDGLNEVTADLKYDIDDSTVSGERLPVTVYNHYEPEGVVLTDWFTHLNPRADIWSYDKCAESDMLAFDYYDPSKLLLYGASVPNSERDAYYHFDINHTDTSVYDSAYGGKGQYVPNRELTDTDNEVYACNLANYGVIYNYNIEINNTGNKRRYLVYELSSESDNLVYVKDSEGNVINNEIISTGRSDTRVWRDMTSLQIPAQSTAKYTVCVVLTPNYPGGMQNSFKIVDYPPLIETYETQRGGIEKDRHFDGHEYYRFTASGLDLSDDRENWRSVKLPGTVMNAVAGNVGQYELKWTGNGYMIKPYLYDAGWYEHVKYMYNDMYLLDKDFNLIRSQRFGGYPTGFACANGVYYVKITGTVFRSDTEFQWWENTDLDLPCWNYGPFSAMTDNGVIKLSTDGKNFCEVVYKGFKPEYIDCVGDMYYYADGRTLYLSKDGLYWRYVVFDNRVKSISFSDGTVIANGEEARAMPEFSDTFAIRLNGKFISGITEPLLIDNSPYIPVRGAAELLGCAVDWNDGAVTVEKDGEVTEINDILMIGETAYAPLKVLPEQLGIRTAYDGAAGVADIELQ